MEYRTLLTILVGALSGVIGGAFGIGGSVIILPSVMLLGIIPDYKMAVGTILLAMLPPISLLAFMEYHKNKKVDITAGIILCIAYFFGSYYGAIINNMYSVKVLEYCTGFSFLLISIYFFYMAYNEKK
jgi:uncharacterized membrane protein YfcA